MITVPEAARRTGRSPETIRRWIRAGKLVSKKVGTQHLVDEADVERLTGRARVGEESPAYKPADDWVSTSAEARKRIAIDRAVLTGRPVVRGTRIPVQLVVELLAEGWSVDDVIENYPRLTDEDVRACLAYAADSLDTERVFPLSAR